MEWAIAGSPTSKNGRPPALPGRQEKFENCGNRKVSSKRSRKILRQGETLRRTGNHGVNVNRPLGGLLQVLIRIVGARLAGELTTTSGREDQ